jgi:hypothetical protein
MLWHRDRSGPYCSQAAGSRTEKSKISARIPTSADPDSRSNWRVCSCCLPRRKQVSLTAKYTRYRWQRRRLSGGPNAKHAASQGDSTGGGDSLARSVLRALRIYKGFAVCGIREIAHERAHCLPAKAKACTQKPALGCKVDALCHMDSNGFARFSCRGKASAIKLNDIVFHCHKGEVAITRYENTHRNTLELDDLLHN